MSIDVPQMIYNEVQLLRKDVAELKATINHSQGFLRGVQITAVAISAFVSGLISMVATSSADIVHFFLGASK